MKKTFISLFILITFSLNTFAQEIPSTILEGHTGLVHSVSFSPDGKTLASGSGDETIRLWDVDTGRLLHELAHDREVAGVAFSDVTSVSFSPDGKTLASGGWDARIRLWDASSGREIRTIFGITLVNSVSFSPDGKTLASGGAEGTIRLWDVDTGEQLSSLRGHTAAVNSVSFSPDGKTLASGSRDETVRLWDASSGDHLRTLAEDTWHGDFVNSVSFSPDGKTLASGSRFEARLWDVATGELIFGSYVYRVVDRYFYSVNSVSFSPDGKTLASGWSDKTVRLWDVDTREQLSRLRGHTAAVNSVSFSPDGKTLASGSRDETVRLWELPAAYTRISITSSPVDAPAIGDTLTLKIDITDGKDITGYQARIIFDNTALRYVESANGDYLPDAFFVPPVVEGNQVTLGATSVADDSSGDGTLATLTFEVIAIKESTLTLSQAVTVNSTGEWIPFRYGNLKSVVVSVPRLREDVNLDGVVDILDLTLVAASFGKNAFSRSEVLAGDVNHDGVVDIKDLIELTILNVALVLEGNQSQYQHTYNTSKTIGLNEEDIVNILVDALKSSDVFSDVRNPADVNEDDVIDIIDLVLVAGALGNKAAAPSIHAQARRHFTASDVKLWLSQAQHKNLTDVQSQRGILFLHQLLAAFHPKKTALLPNYPNPFNPETWIPYQLAATADVSISIYAANGQLIRKMALGHQPVGMYQSKSRAAYWDGRNSVGEPVASGVYFYTLTAGDFTATRKLLIRK